MKDQYTEAEVDSLIHRLTTLETEALLRAVAFELFGDADDYGRDRYFPDRAIDREEHRWAANLLRDAIFGETEGGGR